MALPIWRSLASPQRWWDLPNVGDAGGGDGVALGFEAATHVDRGGAVAPEVDRPTFFAQHEVVVADELGGGEAVVQLHEVEVLGTDAGRSSQGSVVSTQASTRSLVGCPASAKPGARSTKPR